MNKVKKLLALMFAIVLSISMISTTNVSAAKKVKLNKTKATIYIGRTVSLKLKNNKKKVKWTTSNKNIATVSKKGKVKGKKTGMATIIAKVGKKKYKCKVTVKKKVTPQPTTIPTEQPTTKPMETTPPNTEQPTIPSQVDNSNDVESLKKIIKEQRDKGATVSEDIYNKDEYYWYEGKLCSIVWDEKNLTGNLDLTALTSLISLSCQRNQLTEVNISNKANLQFLGVAQNQLTNLELSISNKTNLEWLWCKIII